MSTKFISGKHTGKTFQEVLENNVDYAEFIMSIRDTIKNETLKQFIVYIEQWAECDEEIEQPPFVEQEEVFEQFVIEFNVEEEEEQLKMPEQYVGREEYEDMDMNEKKEFIQMLNDPSQNQEKTKKIQQQEWEDILSSYNQKKSIIIQAYAGCGKTTTIRKLIEQTKDDQRMLYLVFNKKNQQEAEEKIRHDNLTVKTLDSFCMQLLKRICRVNLKFNASFELWNGMVKSTQFRLYMDITKKIIRDYFVGSEIKRDEEIPAEAYDDRIQYLNDNYGGKQPQPNQQLDCNMILHYLIKNLEQVDFNFDTIFIDECQDLNNNQVELIKCMHERGKQIICVGDQYQSIYEFRGASDDSFERLNALFDTKLTLSINYRSNKKIQFLVRQDFEFPMIMNDENLPYNGQEAHLFTSNNEIMQIMQNYEKIGVPFGVRPNSDMTIKDEYGQISSYKTVQFRRLCARHQDRDEKLQLMTVHQSKGFQFDFVVIHGKIQDRNLRYVAMTRAIKDVFIVKSQQEENEEQ